MNEMNRWITGEGAPLRTLLKAGRILDFFKTLRIRIKLSIIIGLTVIFIILILSFIILEGEKRVLKDKAEEICRLCVQSLATAVRDDLLLGQHIPIQDAVVRVMKMRIKGVEFAYVSDRKGVIVAHSDTKRIGAPIPRPLLRELMKGENPVVKESAERYEYISPIYVTKKSSGEVRRVFLGSSHIGFSKSVISEPIEKATKLIFTVAFITIITSILGVYFLAKGMTLRILALARGAKQVARGNLDVQISLSTRDELGDLAREFNDMVVQLREKLQMQKFISQLTMQKIRERAGTLDLILGGERKNITVMFSDVRSFSVMSERLEPEALVKVINAYLQIQSRIIEKHGGVIDKFIGDQIMAIFQGEEMADDALKTAIEIQKAISRLNELRLEENRDPLMVGIGLNLGLAIIGSMGSTNRMDYTAIGDTVNLAARLCSLAKPGQIIAPHGLITKLKGKYSIIKMEPLMIKGRRQPVEVYQICYG